MAALVVSELLVFSVLLDTETITGSSGLTKVLEQWSPTFLHGGLVFAAVFVLLGWKHIKPS